MNQAIATQPVKKAKSTKTVVVPEVKAPEPKVVKAKKKIEIENLKQEWHDSVKDDTPEKKFVPKAKKEKVAKEPVVTQPLKEETPFINHGEELYVPDLKVEVKPKPAPLIQVEKEPVVEAKKEEVVEAPKKEPLIKTVSDFSGKGTKQWVGDRDKIETVERVNRTWDRYLRNWTYKFFGKVK